MSAREWRNRQRGLAVDFDGTMVDNEWPGIGPWLPGAREALHVLSQHYLVQVHTCRLAPVHPSGDPRHAADVATQWHRIRRLLDEADLPAVQIAGAERGKPFAVAYIDDRAIRFNPRRAEAQWRGITDRLLLAAGVDKEDSLA